MMNTIYIQIFFILISITAFSQNISSETNLLRPPKTGSTIIIDGKLNEHVWQRTPLAKQLYDENGQYNNTTTRKTKGIL
ncbi:MAG TPA: hypothetical protein VJ954_07660 [Ignavibacteriaceae bacterium]|nr:hypothetical protein [Ignavibacteriaceae bacterium]